MQTLIGYRREKTKKLKSLNAENDLVKYRTNF